ncbi:MAG: HlyD family secretion protein, partial [Marinifilum sp.]|jgi:HlyD family secretion protein|nr:HlyD family secretion protein [Marinifilum sp.]
MEKDPNIELRSDEVKEILGRVPNWIIRSGTTLFFVVIFAVVVGSYFFRYPDIIGSRLVLTTLNPPAELVARSSGQLQDLRVKDNENVSEGSLLAIIKNPAFNKDVFLLKQQLTVFQGHLTGSESIESNLLESNFRLGEIQSYYNAFLKSYVDYHRFFDMQYYDKKIVSYKDQISKYNMYYDRQYQQKKILESELSISKSQYLRDSSLYQKGVISQSDFQNAKKKYLEQSYSFHGARSSLASTQINISQVKQQIIDLELKKEDERKELQNLLIQSFDNLKAQIDIWEEKYLIRTPIDGIVSFNKFYSANQNVKVGERVFTVLPMDSTKVVARVELGIRGAGKVKIGQRVNIKLDNYPYLEYGMLEGTIQSISKVPEDQKYSLDVDFPNGLVTNYGIELEFAQKIEGDAEIITEDLRLLQRIFNPIRALLKERL